MPINATDDEVRSAGPAHVGSTAAQHKSVDVSSVAVVAAFAGHVTMDAEAFGVTVSRRPGACDTDLTGYERGRLLDVLCHAKAVQRQCQEHETEFPVWVVSSDARDARPRVLWMAIRKEPNGGYHIHLSDA